MGAWGYGPFDNDDAGDFYTKGDPLPTRGALEKALRSVQTPRGRHYHADEARAAAILVAVARSSDAKLKNLAVTALEQIKDDKSWVENWEKPDLMREELALEIESLERKLPASERLERKAKIEATEEESWKKKVEGLRGSKEAGPFVQATRFAKKYKTPLLVGGGLVALYWFFRKPKVAAPPAHFAGYPASTPYPYSGHPAIGWW